MIILDKPYVSDLLVETVLKNKIETLNSVSIKEMELTEKFNFLSEVEAIEQLKLQKFPVLYSNSENSINWIAKNLPDSELLKTINLFKDKAKFRRVLASAYPDFFFLELDFNQLDSLDVDTLKFPFVIKPTVGFLSMGVYAVSDKQKWSEVLASIKEDVQKFQGIFPVEVVDSGKFIIEEMIEGDEFALDVYFGEDSLPVILNVFKHPFCSSDDVSDRAYLTSKKIIEENISKVLPLLNKISKLFSLRNFPMHIEVRISGEKVVPIEVNPMRFAGWCTTDLAYFAYGINPYEYFFESKKPDWVQILKDRDDFVYYFAMAEVPSQYNRSDIKSFDYDKFLENIKTPLEVRKIDWKKHPLFLMVFAQVSDESEVGKILKLNLAEYIIEERN